MDKKTCTMNTENKDQFVYVPVSDLDKFSSFNRDGELISGLTDEKLIEFLIDKISYFGDGYLDFSTREVEQIIRIAQRFLHLKKVPLSSLLPKTIIEPANTSATISDSCVTPLYVQNNIEHDGKSLNEKLKPLIHGDGGQWLKKAEARQLRRKAKALADEAWRMLPDTCKEIMGESLKKTYTESLTEDIIYQFKK